MTDVCLLLKETRQAQGLTLEDVAARTYIKLPYLQALEEGAVEALPAPVYTYGYIRQYAKLLGLDGSQLVAQFQQMERHGGAPRPESPLQRSSPTMADMPGEAFNPFKASYKPNGNGNGYSQPAAAPEDNFNAALNALKGGGTRGYDARGEADSVEMRQAKMQAQQILAGAERDAQQLVAGAERYADDVLAELEGEVAKTLQIIRNGRHFLASRRQGGPVGF